MTHNPPWRMHEPTIISANTSPISLELIALHPGVMKLGLPTSSSLICFIG